MTHHVGWYDPRLNTVFWTVCFCSVGHNHMRRQT